MFYCILICFSMISSDFLCHCLAEGVWGAEQRQRFICILMPTFQWHFYFSNAKVNRHCSIDNPTDSRTLQEKLNKNIRCRGTYMMPTDSWSFQQILESKYFSVSLWFVYFWVELKPQVKLNEVDRPAQKYRNIQEFVILGELKSPWNRTALKS